MPDDDATGDGDVQRMLGTVLRYLKKVGPLYAYGVSYDEALQEMVYRYTYHGLDEDDITRAVNSAYSRIEFVNKRAEIISILDYRGTISAETIEMMYNYKNIKK